MNDKRKIIEKELIYLYRKINNMEKIIKQKEEEEQNIIAQVAECDDINKIKNILEDFYIIHKDIETEKRSNKNRIIDFENKKNKLQITDEQFKKTLKIEEEKYMQIGDANFNVGLYNSECKAPVAICCSKNCFLSYKDIRKKKCLCKNHNVCKNLKWLDMNIYC